MSAILIVEDELHLANGIKFNLEQEDYEVKVCPTAEEAMELYQNYDMMVLDIMLPGMSGIQLLEKLRAHDERYPVLILSARETEEARIEGLTAGADDYMTKPFSLPELLLRVKRMLKRSVWYNGENIHEKPFDFGEYWIDFQSFEAQTNKGVVSLTQYELGLMRYLIENRQRAVSRAEILEEVWGYAITPETRTVDIFIARLRKLFEKDSKSPVHLQSIRGVGYRFFA